MPLLYAAYSYSALCSYRFVFGLGNKRAAARSVEFCFPESAFHHLAGFQYMTRDSKFTSKKQALYHVKAKIITANDFCKHENLQQIRNRWESIKLIENAMQSCRYMMEYTQNQGPSGSKIKAKYVIPFQHDNNTHYYFFNGKTHESVVPVSCILEDQWKYERGCAKWTVLKIEKLNAENETVQVIYQHDSVPS